MVTRQLAVNRLSEIRLYSQRRTGRITQLRTQMLGFHSYGIRCFMVNFVWLLLIPQLCKDCKRHGRNRPLPSSQTAIKKIVKIQLRLTLTILYGDQRDSNYYEIRAKAS